MKDIDRNYDIKKVNLSFKLKRITAIFIRGEARTHVKSSVATFH